MRWFKHMTHAGNDQKLMRLKSEFGMEGYGVYWAILEHIAAQMSGTNNQCFSELPLAAWKVISGISTKKFQKFLTFCALFEIFEILEIEKPKKTIRIGCKNLKKYKDEYTRKNKKTPDKLRTNSGQTPEEDTEYRDRVKEGAAPPSEDSQPPPQVTEETMWDIGENLGVPRGVIGQGASRVGKPKVAEVLGGMLVTKPVEPLAYFVKATTPQVRRVAT